MIIAGYNEVLTGLTELLASARSAAARVTNSIMTATYWEIGRRIIECEQGGQEKADYGKQIVQRLAIDLTAQFGRGFRRSNLFQMRSFYLAYPGILQTPSGISSGVEIVQTPSGQSSIQAVTSHFPLPWSDYVLLLSVRSPEARAFYEAEALRGGWTVRQLARQIDSQFYERTALSHNKSAMLKKGSLPKPEDAITPEGEIKDPFVLEFLGLKDEYSESDLENALIQQLESFLLELGSDFAFIGRQRRLRVDDEWYRVDLLFFHRRLRCLVIIDLKLGKLTHADAGQMHLYLNYAREHWTHPDENPPVGLILCAQKGHAVAHYALEGLPNKVLAAEYRTTLPDEKILAEELERTRHILESRQTTF